MSDEERDDRKDGDLPRAGDLLRWAEQTQRTIDFILRQQAEFQAKSEADMQRLRELYEQNERRWARADEGWMRTREQILGLLAIAEIHEREFFELRQAQAEAQVRTDAQMEEARARADARSAEIDERLNALINTVEKMISERRNGGRGEESSG